VSFHCIRPSRLLVTGEERAGELQESAIPPSTMTGGGISDDARQLAALGHTQELKRTFSPLAMLGLAFAILNSWTALATSLSLALPSGGPTSVLWGLITAGVCNLCLASSLAEFLSAYPSAGGQYHWAAMMNPNNRIISWITGWINVSDIYPGQQSPRSTGTDT
jgi:choline transport protein